MVRFFPKALSFARAKYKVLAQIKGGFKKSICGDRGAVLFGDDASKIIYEMLISEAPCMIARYGTIELACIVNSLNVKKFKSYSVFKKLEKCVTETFKYICNRDGGESFWWEEFVIRGMSNNTGFFAPETQLLPHLERFCDIMLCPVQKILIFVERGNPEKSIWRVIIPKTCYGLILILFQIRIFCNLKISGLKHYAEKTCWLFTFSAS